MSLGKILRGDPSRPEAPNRNGSDQAVVIRTIGAPVEVSVAGETYLVTGGSLRFHETLTRFQDSGKKALQEKRETEDKILEPNSDAFGYWKGISDRVSVLSRAIELIEKNREELGDPEFDSEKYHAALESRRALELDLLMKGELPKVMAYVHDALDIRNHMVVSTNEHCLRLVQFILLNSRNPKWYQEKDRVDTQGFPSEALLDGVIPFDTLYDDADINELSNVIEVFRQINQPELFRKNALALTGIQSSSRGQD